MSPAEMFKITGPLALLGWMALLASPLLPRFSQWVAGLVVPGILSLAYTALILVNWSDAPGGFDTLENVMLLFDVPAVALAGWLHYLAFDLLIGAWIVRTARDEGITHVLVIPCLALTFLFGPVGFALFMAIRYSRMLSLFDSKEG